LQGAEKTFVGETETGGISHIARRVGGSGAGGFDRGRSGGDCIRAVGVNL
jgi:hypothetical protein